MFAYLLRLIRQSPLDSSSLFEESSRRVISLVLNPSTKNTCNRERKSLKDEFEMSGIAVRRPIMNEVEIGVEKLWIGYVV